MPVRLWPCGHSAEVLEARDHKIQLLVTYKCVWRRDRGVELDGRAKPRTYLRHRCSRDR